VSRSLPSRGTLSRGNSGRRAEPTKDAYRGAALLIKQHGDDAELRAAERADELLFCRDAHFPN